MLPYRSRVPTILVSIIQCFQCLHLFCAEAPAQQSGLSVLAQVLLMCRLGDDCAPLLKSPAQQYLHHCTEKFDTHQNDNSKSAGNAPLSNARSNGGHVERLVVLASDDNMLAAAPNVCICSGLHVGIACAQNSHEGLKLSLDAVPPGDSQASVERCICNNQPVQASGRTAVLSAVLCYG